MIDRTHRELAIERCQVAKRVFEQNEMLRGRRDLFRKMGDVWTHGYIDHDAIVTYLLLTCFDLLGQPAKWMTFDNWLRASDTAVARNAVTAALPTKDDPITAAELLFREYQSTYGVRNSFFRFINAEITESARRGLLDSITIHTSSGIALQDDQLSRRFLYDFRNRFTHSGITGGSGTRALASQPLILKGGTLLWGSEQIWSDGDRSYWVRRWPFVLFDTLGDYLGVDYPKDLNIAVEVHVDLPSGESVVMTNIQYKDVFDLAAIERTAAEWLRTQQTAKPTGF
jgi:hypothetical protein